jgi:hypothetical protein
MKLTLKELTVPPAGAPAPKGFVWSAVSVRFEDEETHMMPDVVITVHVPVTQSDTFGAVRELALNRAREVLEAASETLANKTVSDVDQLDV